MCSALSLFSLLRRSIWQSASSDGGGTMRDVQILSVLISFPRLSGGFMNEISEITVEDL